MSTLVDHLEAAHVRHRTLSPQLALVEIVQERLPGWSARRFEEPFGCDDFYDAPASGPARKAFLHDLYERQLRTECSMAYVRSFEMVKVSGHVGNHLFFCTRDLQESELDLPRVISRPRPHANAVPTFDAQASKHRTAQLLGLVEGVRPGPGPPSWAVSAKIRRGSPVASGLSGRPVRPRRRRSPGGCGRGRRAWSAAGRHGSWRSRPTCAGRRRSRRWTGLGRQPRGPRSPVPSAS